MTCFKCGKAKHRVVECKSDVVVCFNCGETGQISTQCQKPKKTQDVKADGKMFGLSGADGSKSDTVLRGTCFINGIHLITIIDMGATYSFIYLDCVKRLNLAVSIMNGSMVIGTPANGSVNTSLVCLNFPLTIYGMYFGIDLGCLPLSQLDVIPGMN
ncbi:uncharacterized protein LOC127131692 [Lathyrus oleraceus]|uniref:uncharacterized protein LOC127131692 n=1 Tax=Pisum sativum TaxID=3888 RepID=UPI0021CE13DF|nr:uncharacterized protein LOC127131692 [Pisum sativum]